MRLILSVAHPTRLLFRDGEPFRIVDHRAMVDSTDVIEVNNVQAFYSDFQGFLVTFKNHDDWMEGFIKTGWVQDENQGIFALFTKYDFSQRCIIVRETAYMDWRIEE